MYKSVFHQKLCIFFTRCQCTNCSQLEGEAQSLCCHHYVAMRLRMNKGNTTYTCITEHPGFQSNCLDIYVLEASYYEFCQMGGEPGDDEPLNETLRYISYRRLVRWIFKKLGQKNRKRLPACAVKAIRENFPSESNEYTGFKYAFG